MSRKKKKAQMFLHIAFDEFSLTNSFEDKNDESSLGQQWKANHTKCCWKVITAALNYVKNMHKNYVCNEASNFKILNRKNFSK